MFMGAYKDNNVAQIQSRETSEKPYILIEFTDGTETIIKANKDTYIVGGTNYNYGTSGTLLVRESGYPYDNKNYRTYINFDLTEIPDGKSIEKATINIYARTQEAEEKVLNLFATGDSSWSETTLNWNLIKGNIYSWEGLESITDWKRPFGADDEYLNVLCRLYYINFLTYEYDKDREKNREYGEKAVDIIMSFLTNNKAGYNRTLETGERLRYVTNAYPSLLTTSNMTADKNAEVIKFIYQDMINLSYAGNWTKNTNWGFFQTNGLFQGTVFLPEMVTFQHYYDMCISRYTYMAKKQTMSDFSFGESTSGYAFTVPSGLLGAKKLTVNNGYVFPEELDDYLYYPVKFMVDSAHVNGYNPTFGDAAYSSMRGTVLDYASVLDDEELLYFATNGEDGTYPSYTSSFYPVGQFANMRSGWSENDTFLRIANNNFTNNGHGHPDHLSVICSAYGRVLLTDVGYGTYSSTDQTANWLRWSTVAHNTIEIGGVAQTKGAETKTTYYAQNDGLDFYEGYTLSNEKFPHYRSVLFVRPGFWIVSDSIVGTGDNVTDFKQTWHYMPNAKPTLDPITKETKTNFKEGANIKIIPADSDDYDRYRIDDGYYSETYGKVENAEYTAYVKMQRNKVNFDTVLYPVREGEDTKGVSVARIETGFDTSVASALKIDFTNEGNTTHTGYYYISHEDEPKRHNFEGFSYDGKVLYTDADSILMVNGTKLTKDGISLVESPTKISDMSLKYEGKTLIIEGSKLVPTVSSASGIKIYAKDVDTVVFNGEEVEFSKYGDYVYAVRTDERETKVLNPTEDAYVVSTTPDTNYNDDYLHVKYSAPERRTYLKFDVSDVNLKELTSAKIRMYTIATSLTDYKELAVFPVDESSWKEDTLTWNNQPSVTDTISITGIGGANQWYEWDITDYLKTFEGDTVSLGFQMLTVSNDDNKIFASSAQEYAPELIIEAPVKRIDVAATERITGDKDVSVKLKNYGNDCEVDVYIAFYNKNNTLVSAIREKVSINENEEKQLTVEKPLEEYDEFKVFIWSDGLNPVVNY